MFKKILIISLTLIMIFAVSCSSSKTRNNKELFINAGEEPKTIDPTLSGNDFVYPRHVFETLITKDISGNLQAGACESLNISDNGLVYTFNLRTNAKWSDGKNVIADDFVYALQRAANPLSGAEYTSFIEYIKNAAKILSRELPVEQLGVKAINDYTLEITLEAPIGYFLDILTYPIFAPVRKDIIEQYGDQWSLKPESYIGNGAFIMTERKLDEKIVVVKNTNYWNKNNIVPEKITFVMMKDANLALAGIKDGSLDFSVYIIEQDLEKLKSEGIVNIAPYFSTVAFGINATNEVLKDTRIRKALSLAIDRNYIVENVVPTAKSPTSAWVPVGAYDVEGDFRENGGEYIDLSKEAYSNNVEMAKQLMAEAGYPNGEGFPVLEYKTTADLVYIQVAEAIQQMWKENLGIDLQISSMEWAAYQQMRSEKNYQLIRTLWIGDYSDPMTFLENYLSYRSQNTSGYSNKQFDNYIESARNSVKQEIRMKAMHEAEKILIAEDNLLIPIYNPSNPVLVSKRLKDYVLTPLMEYHFHYAYLE
ncbi:peptide ABC transporter substrate-binding protein [Brachyspira hyodysenteriae]|uniref:peptide ABC transporter substrate-binding protein n=1 Tax=Brachyspira hyodysenteriae TaxID=159 RepID=UPI001182CB87|nr:peptide ABC transporter substrate-binding protein [Brachyspira hyodysenteriae]TVL43736.1 peptide ABC transporter substrate-binding protein [Brachyspira hyodysenteriae]